MRFRRAPSLQVAHTGLPTSTTEPQAPTTTPSGRFRASPGATAPGHGPDTSRTRSGAGRRHVAGKGDPVGGLYKRKTSVRSLASPSWEALQERGRRFDDASDTDRLLTAHVTNIAVSCTLSHPPIALSCTSPRGERGPHEHRPARHREHREPQGAAGGGPVRAAPTVRRQAGSRRRGRDARCQLSHPRQVPGERQARTQRFREAARKLPEADSQ